MNGLNKFNLKIASEIFSGKSYNLECIDLLRKKNPVVVDIGANIGLFAIAVKASYPCSEIHCVEPDPDAFQCLQSNTSGYTNIHTHNYAITNSDGTAIFYRGFADSVANSVVSGAMTDKSRTVNVETKSAANFLSSIAKHKSVIDILKTDSEGGEWYLLSNLQLLKTVGIIYIEYHSSRFLKLFMNEILETHTIYCSQIRFPHRGELTLVRNDLIPDEQNAYEIVIEHA